MNRLGSCIRAEFLKVTTTKVWWILLALMCTYIGTITLVIGSSITSFNKNAQLIGAEKFVEVSEMIYSMASALGFIFPLLLGALSVTSEYRHRTIIPTFLSETRRGVALSAKLITQLVFGALFGIAALTAAVLGTVFFFIKADLPTGLGLSHVWLQFLRSVLVMSLWAGIGVGLGTLIRNQTAVIVLILAFTQFVEPMLRMTATLRPALLRYLRFLPGASTDAVVGTSFYSLMNGDEVRLLLPWWAAALTLATYALVSLVLGYLFRWTHDVS